DRLEARAVFTPVEFGVIASSHSGEAVAVDLTVRKDRPAADIAVLGAILEALDLDSALIDELLADEPYMHEVGTVRICADSASGTRAI
ncbi:hypothetical protein Q8G81_33970, partial [Klebsiella pneumoniae]